MTVLSTRQHQILTLVADGLTNPQIAKKLALGESTVKSHLDKAYARLGAQGRAHAVALAMRAGVLA